MPSLSDKLKSLGVKVGAADLAKPKPKSRYPIEEVVDGRFIDTPAGQAFVVERQYPPDHQHGRVGLGINASLQVIAAWAHDPRFVDINPHDFIFLDTETSGLAGGTGTYAFLIGTGRLTIDGFILTQYFMRDPAEEAAQLNALVGFIGNYSGLVTFNGKAFDIPILNARFINNGEIPPFKHSVHLDLLHLARRLWRDRLPSRTLGFLEQNILLINRTIEDVPGWLVPQLYFDYLKTGDARPLKSVFYHNAMDVVSMAALLNFITATLEDPFLHEIDDAIDIISLAKLREDLGNIDEAARLYRLGLTGDLPEAIRSEALQRWSFMEKRRQNYDQCIALWQQVTERKEIYAFEELAKFYEHHQRNYAEALRWTESALVLVNSSNYYVFDRKLWRDKLKHRQVRLEKKFNQNE
jgi:uncharacterized protein YprB with RNaseH-like and TPR domain